MVDDNLLKKIVSEDQLANTLSKFGIIKNKDNFKKKFNEMFFKVLDENPDLCDEIMTRVSELYLMNGQCRH